MLLFRLKQKLVEQTIEEINLSSSICQARKHLLFAVLLFCIPYVVCSAPRMSIFFFCFCDFCRMLVVCAAHHRIDGLLAFDKRGAVSARVVMFALPHSCYVQ